MWRRGLFLFVLSVGSLRAQEKKTVASSSTSPSVKVFLDLLQAYKRYPEFFSLISKKDKTFDDVDPRVVVRLPSGVLESRLKQFNRDYVTYRKLEKTTAQQLEGKKKELEQVPFSDAKRRGKLELDTKALESRYQQVRKVLFLLSVDANTSILEALQTLPPEQRVVKKEEAPSARPRLPGVFGGTRQTRLTQKEIDKINLTPVDPEFSKTQLGQKLKQDLGAPVEAWSYDFNKDDLYVLVGNNVSKIRVKEDSPGVRYIQTRVGSRFEEPVGSDLRVNMIEAQGRFLTGNSKEETLFGKMPQDKTLYLDQIPAGHDANDGHNHSHDHSHE